MTLRLRWILKDEGVEEEVEKIPKFTQETLKEMTVKELREFCHKWV